MQSNTSARNLIFNGRYPFSQFGAQTDRNYPKPDPNRTPQLTTGPNDITTFHYIISLRSLTEYTGSDAENSYLITLPSVIDRPKLIQVVGNTVGHQESGVGIKTILLQTPVVKQSGYTLDSTSNSTTTSTDGIMGIIRSPHINLISNISTISTIQVDMQVPVKDQGYSRLVGIPIRFLDNRGRALSVIKDDPTSDLSADGEIMLQIQCETYNPTKQTART